MGIVGSNMSFLQILFALLPAMAAPAKIHFFIGTYTGARGSKGIYEASVDSKTGLISQPSLVAEASNPSYVALTPDGKFLYAVHEDDKGSVSAYKVGPDFNLSFLNTQPIPGSAPCYLSVDPTGKNLLVASYVGGTIACLPIDSHGDLKGPSTHLVNKGSGPDKSRQDASHMHWILSDSKAETVYTCDLGTDKVQAYKFDPAEGILAPLPDETGHVPPGSGPRHGAFNPSRTILYVTNEMGNSVTAFHVNSKTGGLSPFQTLPTLTEGEIKSTSHLVTTAEIDCHSNGKWLYVSNRGHDSITQFKIAHDGTLERVHVTKLEVIMPRGFAIDPSGEWLIVGGQESDDLASYSIDRATGNLRLHAHLKGIGKPVCIVFAKP